MKLLLDTHTLLWCLGKPAKLSKSTRELIEKNTVPIWVSSVSAWEIAIKSSLGKLKAPGDLEKQIDLLNFQRLLVNFEDAKMLYNLPFIHRDPFDRMLVAQAKVHDLTLVTQDDNIIKYEVNTLPA